MYIASIFLVCGSFFVAKKNIVLNVKNDELRSCLQNLIFHEEKEKNKLINDIIELKEKYHSEKKDDEDVQKIYRKINDTIYSSSHIFLNNIKEDAKSLDISSYSEKVQDKIKGIYNKATSIKAISDFDVYSKFLSSKFLGSTEFNSNINSIKNLIQKYTDDPNSRNDETLKSIISHIMKLEKEDSNKELKKLKKSLTKDYTYASWEIIYEREQKSVTEQIPIIKYAFNLDLIDLNNPDIDNLMKKIALYNKIAEVENTSDSTTGTYYQIFSIIDGLVYYQMSSIIDGPVNSVETNTNAFVASREDPQLNGLSRWEDDDLKFVLEYLIFQLISGNDLKSCLQISFTPQERTNYSSILDEKTNFNTKKNAIDNIIQNRDRYGKNLENLLCGIIINDINLNAFLENIKNDIIELKSKLDDQNENIKTKIQRLLETISQTIKPNFNVELISPFDLSLRFFLSRSMYSSNEFKLNVDSIKRLIQKYIDDPNSKNDDNLFRDIIDHIMKLENKHCNDELKRLKKDLTTKDYTYSFWKRLSFWERLRYTRKQKSLKEQIPIIKYAVNLDLIDLNNTDLNDLMKKIHVYYQAKDARRSKKYCSFSQFSVIKFIEETSKYLRGKPINLYLHTRL